jgi:hypothetical protein
LVEEQYYKIEEPTEDKGSDGQYWVNKVQIVDDYQNQISSSEWMQMLEMKQF